MRDLMHGLMDKHGGIQEVIDAEADWELEAYLAYWLAGSCDRGPPRSPAM